MTMNREERIIKNSLVFAIGNLGSKVISYIIVLLYTYYISADQLGYYDVIASTINLLQPFAILGLDEGVYRWLIEAQKQDHGTIISTCLKVVFISTALLGVIFIPFFGILKYAFWIAISFVSTTYYHLLLNSVRGLTNNKLYAASGIFWSGVLLTSQFVGLTIFDGGVKVLFVAQSIANIATIFLLLGAQTEIRSALKYKFNKKIASQILAYSFPLIPNALSWWVVNSSDRYIILLFLGTSANGIYAISNKFPTVITMVVGVLYYALQESVIKECSSPDRDKFYSKIFQKYYVFLFCLALCGIPLTKLTVTYFVGNEYREAWRYTGFLFLSTVFSALSGFLGIGYQITKNTRMSATTALSAAVVNIFTNLLLVRHLGLHAAAISTFLSYIFLYSVRMYHFRRCFFIKVNYKMFVSLFVLSLISMVVTYFGGVFSCALAFGVGVVALGVTQRSVICFATQKVFKKFS